MRFRVVVTTVLRAPTPEGGRDLAATDVARVSHARAWMSRNAATWVGALAPTDRGFIGFVVDDDGEPARTIEYGRDPDEEPVELGRGALRAMRRRR